jgi:hypothetical protein
MHAEIPIRHIEKLLQLHERKNIVYGERAQDREPLSLMYQLVDRFQGALRRGLDLMYGFRPWFSGCVQL